MSRRSIRSFIASAGVALLLGSACSAPERMAAPPDTAPTSEVSPTPDSSPTDVDPSQSPEPSPTVSDPSPTPDESPSPVDPSESPTQTSSPSPTPSASPSVSPTEETDGASPGKRFIRGPRTFEVRNITPIPLQVKISQVDNFDWGQEREPDGRPDHTFPLGIQGYVLDPMESVAVALYPNLNATSSPFKLAVNPVGQPSATVWSDRFTSVRCIKGIDTDPTCYWKPVRGNSTFKATLDDGTTTSGKVTTTNFSTDMLTRVVLRADSTSAVETQSTDDVSDPTMPLAAAGKDASRGMHPTTITNDSDLTLTFKVTGVNPEGHLAGKPRPDDPYPRGFDGMVLGPGESGGMAVWPDLTNWMFGGDGSRSDFTISAYHEGSPVFSTRVRALTSNDNPLVGGYDWGLGGSSFMDRRYVTFTDSTGERHRAFLWSIYGGKTGECDGIHWCMRRELQIQPRS